jgi:hypothetical protein
MIVAKSLFNDLLERNTDQVWGYKVTYAGVKPRLAFSCLHLRLLMFVPRPTRRYITVDRSVQDTSRRRGQCDRPTRCRTQCVCHAVQRVQPKQTNCKLVATVRGVGLLADPAVTVHVNSCDLTTCSSTAVHAEMVFIILILLPLIHFTSRDRVVGIATG